LYLQDIARLTELVERKFFDSAGKQQVWIDDLGKTILGLAEHIGTPVTPSIPSKHAAAVMRLATRASEIDLELQVDADR
jgi:hypothetical protein